MKQLLLISGIPGTGKTEIGNYLASDYGFSHFHIEELKYIPDIHKVPDKSVFTWGFVPDDPHSLTIVEDLISSGFKMIWFDGDRNSAKRKFIARNTVPVEFFEIQVSKINNADIVERFKPKVINTFKVDGSFKEFKEITEELIA